MAETSTEAHQAAVLAIFSRLKEGRISAGDLKKKLAAKPKPGQPAGPDEAEADRALAELIGEGLLATSGGAKDGPHPRPNASYRLTEKGRHHLRPARPGHVDEVLKYQEAFILLQVSRAEGQSLTRSKLNEKLKTVAAVSQLDFNVKEDPGTVDYHLANLVEKGHLGERRNGLSVGYTLTDEGMRALAASDQHQTVTFSMKGEALNALLATARGLNPADSATDDSSVAEEPADETPAPTVGPVGEEDIEKYIDYLRSDKYAGKDLIPIHEVRRLVARHHGDQAAGHPAFDPLLKRMRSDARVRLIAIADNRDATQAELDNSIPGLNETIFYIVAR